MYKEPLIFVLAILCIVLLLQRIKPFREDFVDGQVNAPVMYSILPSLQDSWLGVSLSSPNKGGNMRMTTSLPSRLWTNPLVNSLTSEKHVIIHLNYCKDDMALLGCGVKKVGGKVEWKIFKKENKNPVTKWELVESNEPICATLYDNDGILLGVHAENGQIYKKKTTLLSSEWDGPYNFDLPMSKIYYDRDGIMIGIHKETGKLYKKTGFFWNKDKWGANLVNNQNVLDIVIDYDGCMLGLTKDGIVKQIEPGFLSQFKPYTMGFKERLREPMSFDEIIKARCGFMPRLDEISDIEHLDKELINMINFKKTQRAQCGDRTRLIRNAFGLEYDETNNLLTNIEKRDGEISVLTRQVDTLKNILKI